MFVEICRAIIQKVMSDKILMGLVALGIIAAFVSTSGHDVKEEPPVSAEQAEAVAKNGGEQKAGGETPDATEENGEMLTPKLASEFVKWWIQGSMDFSPTTAHRSHIEAHKWMTSNAAGEFEKNFWSPDRSRDVLNGNVTMSFQPQSVEAIAVNQDKSIVVSVKGIMVSTGVQPNNPNPVREQVETDYLVRRAAGGLRIAGLYNRILSETPVASYY